MSNPWNSDDWLDLLQEDQPKEQEFKRLSTVFILNDKQTLKFILEFLVNNVNTATGKYAILFENQLMLELGQIDVVKIQELLFKIDVLKNTENPSWFQNSIYEASSLMKKEKTLKKICIISSTRLFRSESEVTSVILKSNDLVESKIQLQIYNLGDLDYKLFQKLNAKCYSEDQNWAKVSYDELKLQLLELRDGRAIALELQFYLSESIQVPVKGYKNIVECKAPTSQKIDPRSRNPVKSKVTYLDSLTAKELKKEEISYYYSFGGEKCVFSKEEISHIKDWGAPSICLLGFRPSSALKDKFCIDSSYFLVPNEQKLQGTTQLFSHLVSRMLKKDVVGFGTMVPRRGANLRLVALVPNLEDGDRLNVIPLPFADEMRPIPSLIVDLRTLN